MLRTQEERGLLYRLVARHWDMGLTPLVESPSADEMSTAMRLRTYNLHASGASKDTSTRCLRLRHLNPTMLVLTSLPPTSPCSFS